MDFIDKYFSNGMTLIVTTLLVLAIAYRYYSAFLAAKVFALDAGRRTPAHTLSDGQNYHPTNKWVLFGHHFAAISGAGPLIGPVLAAQFGYLPGFLWILIGVCLAGAVQDFTILVLSTRRQGKSLAQLAFAEIGPVAGTAATIGILFVLVIALAGLGKVVTKALGGETVRYPEKTQFIAPVASPFTVEEGIPAIYRIPADTTIIYPDGTQQIVTSLFKLESRSLNPSVPSDLIVPMEHRGTNSKLVIPADSETVRKIPGSAWGTFTIALTIPIAIFIGWYMYRVRKGKILEASIIGAVLTLAAVYCGGLLDGAAGAGAEGGFFENLIGWLAALLFTFRDNFNLSERGIGVSMAIYGFVASILPVWFLLCPRDYLSSFLKIGTVVLMVLGVIFAHPHLQAPAFNTLFSGGGPVVAGSIFPFVFITIMCGAISGFHALVSSGTTAKMLDKETDARPIGFGAMLIEGLVAILALIAATSLPSSQFYHMNTSLAELPKYQQQIVELSAKDRPLPGQKEVQPLSAVESAVGENLEGRTGGAVTLAVGMADIFDGAARNILNVGTSRLNALSGMVKYWYHFAIMFEALFILTTIDTGTRVGRFLLQETMGKWIHPKLGKTDSWPSAIIATALMVLGWWYFLDTNSVQTIWPMFGIANQMLAVMALAIGAVALVHMKKSRFLAVMLVPMAFVIVTTVSAAVIMLRSYFHTITATGSSGPQLTSAILSSICILAIVICTGCVAIAALFAAGRPPREPAEWNSPSGQASGQGEISKTLTPS